jgi:MGT family glycosyltransferase
MTNTHIAVFTNSIPAGTNPTFSVLRTLVRRGYRVSYVTSEKYRTEVQQLGGEALLIPVLKKWYHQNRSDALATDLYDLACRTVALVSSFYKINKPDLVLHDGTAFAGIVIAQQAGVQAIRITAELAFTQENVSRLSAPPDFVKVLEESLQQSRRFLEENGIRRSDARYDPAHRTIYFYLRDMQIAPRPHEYPSLYAARCAPERPIPGTWINRRAGDRKTVLITASTCYIQPIDYYRMCIEALTGLNYRLLIAIGENIDSSELNWLPPHSEIVKGIPQLLVLPHVDLIIGLGGSTTQMEAAYHGVPLLMLTHGYAEAELYADRAETLGLGIHIRQGQLSSDVVRQRAIALLERSEFRESVRQAQAAVKRSPGSEEVANWIEEQLGISNARKRLMPIPA